MAYVQYSLSIAGDTGSDNVTYTCTVKKMNKHVKQKTKDYIVCRNFAVTPHHEHLVVITVNHILFASILQLIRLNSYK